MSHSQPKAVAPGTPPKPVAEHPRGGNISPEACPDGENSDPQGALHQDAAEPLDRSGAGEINGGDPSAVGSSRKPSANEHTSAGN